MLYCEVSSVSVQAHIQRGDLLLRRMMYQCIL